MRTIKTAVAAAILGVTTGLVSGADNKLLSGNEPKIRVLLSQTSGVITLPLEEYLRGVVPSEIGGNAPEQARCAQAVAARSFAGVALAGSKHEHEGADVCSTVHCQVYNPKKITEACDAAVSATRGVILTYNGKPMSAYYSSHCGGHTEEIASSWPERSGSPAYNGTARMDSEGSSTLDLTSEADFEKWLASSPDSYCNPEKNKVLDWAGRNFRWQRELKAEDVTTMVAKHKPIGRVVKIRTGKRGVSGRLESIELVGTKGTLRIGPQIDIRQFFQPMLKSSAFVVATRGPENQPTDFILRGTGSGHAVGMCQTGAMGMANAGKSFREILKHYYPKAEIEKLY